jgi:15-cis-phytoene synthase
MRIIRSRILTYPYSTLRGPGFKEKLSQKAILMYNKAMDKTAFDSRLKNGFSTARQITRQHSHTFYFASRFLPEEKRAGLYSVYALCRLSDDAVDNEGLDKAGQLRKTREKIDLCYGTQEIRDDLLLSFRYTVNKHGIPRGYFDELLQGMEADLTVNRYATFDRLYSYCYKVAGVIGLIMLSLFDSKDPDARQPAVKLGIAIQLTNIIRDIKEDLVRNRIYLPADEMEKYGVTESDLKDNTCSPAFREFMAFQIKRARSYYAQSGRGIPLIRPFLYRLVILAIKENYAKILDDIERHDYDVFSRRAYVSAVIKAASVPRLLIRALSHEN